ncbi:beta/gamma crystallin-related protein [Aquimarina sp. RZ0]|uniref:VPS10 domain-containing protein n=1 Tax=Aquimarina sp. RZ0 TaxID=2607730 RepID=UPI0011F22223|nr:beta/gamma crystallin-related protein [Aquimarina sp. RZ0]KAA1243581.1 T9SS type A sorting domain-containing protein [Aquimarina sp. RZ0]
MKKLYIFLILILISSISHSQSHQWKRTNPGGGGWFSSIGASKSGIVLAGSDLSGAYRSKNGGRTWDVCGASRGINDTHIGGMGFHRTNGNIMFIATGGIYKTTNGGDSWDRVMDGGGYVSDIELATDKPWIGYASRHKGNWNTLNAEVWKTTNTGNSWVRVDRNLPKTRIIKIVVNPKNADEVYLVTGKGRPVCSVADVYKSTNGGINWKNITANNNFEGFTEVADFAIDPKNPNTLYITAVKADCDNRFWMDGLASKFYKSTNGGNSWTKMQDQGGQIFIHPQNSNITLVETRAVAGWNPKSGTRLSTDGGRSFTKLSDVTKWQTTFHGETQGTYSGIGDGYSRTVGEDLSNANNFYWTNSQWVMGSKDGGKNFNVLHAKKVGANGWQSTGVDNIVNYDMSISPKNPNIIYLALADMGVWRSLNKGQTWENCNTDDIKYGWGNGKGGNAHSIIADPDRENVVWTTVRKGFILKSTNKGERSSWIEVSTGLESKEFVNGLSIDVKSPRNNRTLFATANGDVYKSINDGNKWSKVLVGGNCNFTAIDQQDRNLIYAGGTKGLWRSTNGGKNWNRLGSFNKNLPADNTLLEFGNNRYKGIYDIKTDPNNKNWVYVTVFEAGKERGLFRSKNKGNSWEKLLTDKFMRKVAIMPKNSNILYATSSSALYSGGLKDESNGIWFSKDGGANWVKQNKGMAYPFGNAVSISNQDKPFVMVGVPGTGFQKADVPVSGNNGGGNDDIVTLYEHCNYVGNRIKLGVGDYPNITNEGFKNDDASSLKIRSGFKITLYEHYNFEGRSITLTSDDNCLTAKTFNDEVSSMKVSRNQGQGEQNIEVNGEYLIQNTGNNQNVIAPSWENHNVRMYASNTIFNDHKWQFRHLGNGIHEIKNIGTNRFLETTAGKCDKNANINTWTSAGANHQKWYVTKIGKNHFLRPTHCTTMALDKSTGDDGNVKLWDYTIANNNQKFKLIPVTSRSSEAVLSGITISPNPVQTKLKVDLSNYAGEPIYYTVSTITGQLVKNGTFKTKHNDAELLNFDQLQKGIYIIRFKPENHKEQIHKFIKM